MKYTAFIISLTYLSLELNAQSCTYLTLDDSVSSSCIKLDTSGGNLWKIGQPNKLIFNSAYSSANAIITDTANFYSSNNTSVFKFSVTTSWNPCGAYLTFYHKYDTDVQLDGGTIELSINKGVNWRPMLVDNWDSVGVVDWNSPSPVDSISSLGMKGYSGSSAGWEYVRILIIWNPYHPDSLMFRFTFKSDSINNDKEGWIIDNIFIQDMLCPSVSENEAIKDQLNLLPNPIKQNESMRLVSDNLKIRYVEILNLLGQKLYKTDVRNHNNIIIPVQDLVPGIYICKVISSDGKYITQKFLVQ